MPRLRSQSRKYEMSRPPRRSRHLGRHRPSVARVPSLAKPVDGVRALVEEGIVAAAALRARDDLELAAASTHRLGALTSGMWRALSRELVTAAERLERSTAERLDDIHRRADLLEVEVDDVFRAGEAAEHLAEHNTRIETLLGPADDGRQLLGADLLFGFGLDAVTDDDDETEPASPSVQVTLFFWAEPLLPATVAIAPSLPAGSSLETAEDVALDLGLSASPLLLVALATATELPPDRLNHALTQLGTACWTAHHLDELPPDDAEAEDLDPDVVR